MLENIKSPMDIKRLNPSELNALCEEIRQNLICTISKNGGHLASNLGVVELTVALHRKFDSPKDKIIFDVGHQCYTHKILTGRFDKFGTIRTENGLSGFLRPEESEHDIFVSGHSSTSISAGLGLAEGLVLSGNDGYVVSVIGDGALTGGLAYEALNNAGKKKRKLIVILNDNKMSISKNVGAMSRHLAVLRSRPSYFKVKSRIESFLIKIPFIGENLRDIIFAVKKRIKNLLYNSSIFESMGFSYIGPIDGHDIEKLEHCFEIAKKMKRPALIHICTVKGKGYAFAERSPNNYHGVPSGMDVDTGENPPSSDSFSYQFGKTLIEIAKTNPKICAITAAMCDGTGLSEFSKIYPERFFDVGIAEEHALTFASGLSKGGMIPVVVLYSSFLQRGYDQIIHDIAAQNLKVIICVDRSGIVGEDGEMHHGLFDVAFMNSIPNTCMFSPSTFEELSEDIKTAVNGENKLYVIRYPKGGQCTAEYTSDFFEYHLLENENSISAIVTFGRLGKNAVDAVKKSCGKNIAVDVLCFNKIRPISDSAVERLLKYQNLYFFEEGIKIGGFSQELACVLYEHGYTGKINITAVDDCFVPHGKTESLLKKYSLDADGMFNTIIGDNNV